MQKTLVERYRATRERILDTHRGRASPTEEISVEKWKHEREI